MTSVTFYTIGSVLLVSAVSLVGVALIGLSGDAFAKALSMLISFAVGGLLGDVFIHILPEIASDGPEFFPSASLIMLGGILLSFLLEKVIHWRHCHSPDCPEHPRALGLVSLFGDAVHNFADGLLIAGSYLVNVPTGIATTLAVVLHEIPQEIGDYAILRHSGYTRSRAVFLNFLTALAAIAGATLVLLLQKTLPDMERYLLPLVAGNFLYIAIADLLPELHKQTRASRSAMQLFVAIAGVAVMFALRLME